MTEKELLLERTEAKKLNLIPLEDFAINTKCVWFSTHREEKKNKKHSEVIIASEIIADVRVRINHVLPNDKIREGGYINTNELYFEK